MSNYAYVQLDLNGIVVGASQLSALVEHELLRRTAEFRPDLVGMRWVGDDQYEPVRVEPVEPPEQP